MDRVRNIKELKAASMSVMYESMVITDRVYSRIKGDELQAKVVNLAGRDPENSKVDEKIDSLEDSLNGKINKGINV